MGNCSEFADHSIMIVNIKVLLLFTTCFIILVEGRVQEEIIEIGKNFSFVCISTTKDILWMHNTTFINKNNKRFNFSPQNETEYNSNSTSNVYKHILKLGSIEISDGGIYSCMSSKNKSILQFHLQPIIHPVIVKNSGHIREKIGNRATLFCVFEVYPQNSSVYKNLKWLKESKEISLLNQAPNPTNLNLTHFNYSLEFNEIYKKENGSYECALFNDQGYMIAKNKTFLLVLDVPQVSIDFSKAIGASKIFLNWTYNDGNEPIQKYFIQYAQEGSPTFTYYKDSISGNNTSYVLENFQPNTTYFLRISAKNSIGSGTPHQYHFGVQTLSKDPIFIPKLETTGSTASTITISWSPPPVDLLDFIQYYELVVSEVGETPRLVEKTIYQQNSRNLPYMFDNLKTATEYEFKVRACNDLAKVCGPWSLIVNGTTMDGTASKPTELVIKCNNHDNSRLNSILITWNVPNKPNGKVVSYLISLEGTHSYKSKNEIIVEKWGPKIRRVDEPQHKTIYDGVSANTNYTVTVSAITRHKKIGETAESQCFMPISVPDVISTLMWNKLEIDFKKFILRLYIPKISERNGQICCYRIYIVKLKYGYKELLPPKELVKSTFSKDQTENNTWSTIYIAEMFAGTNFQSEILLGDGKRFTENENNLAKNDKMCMKCVDTASGTIKKLVDSFTSPHMGLNQEEDFIKSRNQTEISKKLLKNNVQQSLKDAIEKINDINLDALNQSNLNYMFDVNDEEFDINSNYTGFLEVIVRDGYVVLKSYSDYFEIISPVSEIKSIHIIEDVAAFLYVVIQVLAVFIAFIIVVLMVLCFLRHYSTKNTVPGEEALSLRESLIILFGGRSNNRSHFISSINQKRYDVGPIHKSDLLNAFKNRHKDTDYGFLREYEMLPNRFSDRTTKNSDMKDNSFKNRYPDIKAYDQTRVKLSPVNGNPSSDYINANFVIGYKERKKFICAQGPMESTIVDFWRMIWEQHLEIIVMLTNLEEYNKSKCAKYWPEKLFDIKQFGDVTIKFVHEKTSSDYVIRTLDIFKKNLIGEDQDQRQITQYHYLSWKDFMAPEHPYGIIKFVRKINSVYSLQRGPILVHCSAGVGRTGTFVALDSLMQQLEEEDIVSIFNTVCDLRHQRNFLVQSLKQYIFLYRALLDTAIFGNTELSSLTLSSDIDNLKFKYNDGKDKCKLEMEYEKILSASDEINKPMSVGLDEMNKTKNRSELIIPFDRNRVLLNPLPLKDNSTYINASFIEGYNETENYIITQDPLENTTGDFWRMISEYSVSTLIMISEVGEGANKCPRYWSDDEIQYEHIRVKYIQNESCPYYTRREFLVINCKIDDSIKVTQFQYNGWPTVDGEVPEVCRGIIELVDQASCHYNNYKSIDCRSPLVVHCSFGTDRSSIFVAMCILVQQLRLEKSVDVCSVTRKLRSQRPGLINSYAQYEFLHRAILNYYDLHKLSESN